MGSGRKGRQEVPGVESPSTCVQAMEKACPASPSTLGCILQTKREV